MSYMDNMGGAKTRNKTWGVSLGSFFNIIRVRILIKYYLEKRVELHETFILIKTLHYKEYYIIIEQPVFIIICDMKESLLCPKESL